MAQLEEPFPSLLFVAMCCLTFSDSIAATCVMCFLSAFASTNPLTGSKVERGRREGMLAIESLYVCNELNDHQEHFSL